jgi:hypothetical protein
MALCIAVATPLLLLRQVRHTYAYWDNDYGVMNEKQVSIAESTIGAKTVGWDSLNPSAILNVLKFSSGHSQSVLTVLLLLLLLSPATFPISRRPYL